MGCPVSAQPQTPAVPRSSSLLPTLCLSLSPHKSGMMSPECQQWPPVGCRGLTRARRGKSAYWLTGEDVSKDCSGSTNCHPSTELITDTTVGDAALPGTAGSLTPHHRSPVSHLFPLGTHPPHNTLPIPEYLSSPGEGGPKAGATMAARDLMSTNFSGL